MRTHIYVVNEQCLAMIQIVCLFIASCLFQLLAFVDQESKYILFVSKIRKKDICLTYDLFDINTYTYIGININIK